MYCSDCGSDIDGEFAGDAAASATRPPHDGDRLTLMGSQVGPAEHCSLCGAVNFPGWIYCSACGLRKPVVAASHKLAAGLLAAMIAVLAFLMLWRLNTPLPAPVETPSVAAPAPVTSVVITNVGSGSVAQQVTEVYTSNGGTVVMTRSLSTSVVYPSPSPASGTSLVTVTMPAAGQ